MPSLTANDLTQQILKSPTKQARNLIKLFEALNEASKDADITIDATAIFTDGFTDFYLKQARKTTAENPDSLAAQLLLIAQKALIDQLAQRESNCLAHAKTVAEALIHSHCKPSQLHFYHGPQARWFTGVAAVLLFGLIGWFGLHLHKATKSPIIAKTTFDSTITNQIELTPNITADQASEMYQKFEMMRNGTCRYLEAIQIPDEHKSIYIENVMGGKLPNNLKDLAIANTYLEKIQCSYTPMLMKKST